MKGQCRLKEERRRINEDFLWSLAAKTGYEKKNSLEFLRAFVKSVQPKVVLELGTAFGASSAFMASDLNSGKVVTIDNYDGCYAAGPDQIRNDLEQLGLADKIILVKGNTRETSSSLKRAGIKISPDIVFMDADHAYKGLKKEYDSFSSLLPEEHAVIVDDISIKAHGHCAVEFVADLSLKYPYCLTVKDFHNGMAILCTNSGLLSKAAGSVEEVLRMRKREAKSIPMVAENKGRTRILFPCGIGDVYWSLVKFQAFCKQKEIEDPYVAIITTTPQHRYAGSEFRSIEFLKMIPFLKLDDPPNREAHPIRPEPKWLSDIYMSMWHGTRTNYPGFMGYDHFLVYNGAVTNGTFLEDIDDLDCNWHFPINISKKQEEYRKQCQQEYGKYVVYLWSFCGGGYSDFHVKEFSVENIIKSTIQFTEASGTTPVFVGSWWDTKYDNNYLKQVISHVPGSIDLVGKTNIDQLFGVIRGSEMVVGCHCGPTIMATAFGKKTIILWSKSYPLFKESSPFVVAPPDTRNTTYHPLGTYGLTVEAFAKEMKDLYEQQLIGTCICGSHQFEKFDKSCYHVTETGESVADEQQFGKCNDCNVIQQLNVPFNSEYKYAEYYRSYPPTTKEYKAKDWNHDLELARMRCDTYRIQKNSKKRILDVGSGSGAFVHECRDREQEAFGCELSTYAYEKSNSFIYRKAFEKIRFPVDNFDLVTCHDVLEHSLNPQKMMEEMFRITKQEGECIVDFPRFYHSSGAHHWKDKEHIWFFNEDQLVELAKKVGFNLEELTHPIESKILLKLKKPTQKRVSIIVPPGIGDSYWSIVKLQSFISAYKTGLPDVYVVSPRARGDGYLRSLPFLEMFPFFNTCSGFVAEPDWRSVWDEAYRKSGRTIFSGKDSPGYDYFISYNGHLRVGEQLEDVDPGLRCNWHPPMFVSLEQESYKAEIKKKYSPYFVCYFPYYSTYRHWLLEYSYGATAHVLSTVGKSLGMRPVFVGAQWDHDFDINRKLLEATEGAVDLTGQTSIDQAFGVLKGAEFVVGHPSGLTILAAKFGIKTLMIWNRYYHPYFSMYCVPPDVRNSTYFTDWTQDLENQRFICELMDLAKEGHIDSERYPSATRPDLNIKPRPKSGPRLQKTVRPISSRRLHGGLKKVSIVCVLKSGGAYNPDYVARLVSAVNRNTKKICEFTCLTDMDVDGICKVVPLIGTEKGFWSKVELFRKELISSDPVWYFDLDTLIVGSLDSIFELDLRFGALRPWKPSNLNKGMLASGVMTWQGDYSYIYEEFRSNSTALYRAGDQEYITECLKKRGIQYQALQNLVSGIYSYKRSCKRTLPGDAKIVCFHGHPRPHETLSVNWVRNNWK